MPKPLIRIASKHSQLWKSLMEVTVLSVRVASSANPTPKDCRFSGDVKEKEENPYSGAALESYPYYVIPPPSCMLHEGFLGFWC
jgi:hypothetical protein